MTPEQESFANFCRGQGFIEGRESMTSYVSTETIISIVGWRQRLAVALAMLVSGGRFTILGPHTVERMS